MVAYECVFEGDLGGAHAALLRAQNDWKLEPSDTCGPKPQLHEHAWKECSERYTEATRRNARTEAEGRMAAKQRAQNAWGWKLHGTRGLKSDLADKAVKTLMEIARGHAGDEKLHQANIYVSLAPSVLIALARSHAGYGDLYLARVAVEQAQHLWLRQSRPRGEKPDLTTRDWTEAVGKLMRAADRNAQLGYKSGASVAVKRAQEIWERYLPDPDTCPDLSDEERTILKRTKASIEEERIKLQNTKVLIKTPRFRIKAATTDAFDCLMCLVGIAKGDDAVVTKCSHIFCAGCIYTWAGITPTCPVCERDL